MTVEEFIALIAQYGAECTAAGAGYTVTDDAALLEEIIRVVKKHWKDEDVPTRIVVD